MPPSFSILPDSILCATAVFAVGLFIGTVAIVQGEMGSN